MQLCTHKWRKQIERQPRLSLFTWDVSVHTLIFPKEVLVRANGKEEENKRALVLHSYGFHFKCLRPFLLAIFCCSLIHKGSPEQVALHICFGRVLCQEPFLI